MDDMLSDWHSRGAGSCTCGAYPYFALIRNVKASFHIHDPHSERVFGRCVPCERFCSDWKRESELSSQLSEF